MWEFIGADPMFWPIETWIDRRSKAKRFHKL